MEIKNVIICGLGAVGLTYGGKFRGKHRVVNTNDTCSLKILADRERVEKYLKNPPLLNGEKLNFDYITPDMKTAPADLIIITTKNDGLESAIEYIKNFVGENTIILSLLNGVTSEEKIADVYGKDKVLYSYFIGHSAVREGNNVTQDGVGKICFGSPYKDNQDKVQALKEFFEKNNIDYEIPEDILYSLWLKFTFNTYANQLSAILRIPFGEMTGKYFEDMAKAVIGEVKEIAEKEGVNIEGVNINNLERDALDCLKLMCPEGKTSMLQDIEAGRKTEVDIFSGEIIRKGRKYGISTPYNELLYNMIKFMEN